MRLATVTTTDRRSAPAATTQSGSIFFIGNATTLIRYAGFTILTDPTFIHRHGRVPLGYGLHTTRLTDPALDIPDLPPIGLIVLSHLHGDHFDQVAIRDLNKAVPIVTTPESARELRAKGFRTLHPLETWTTATFMAADAQLRVTALPGRHGPGLLARALPRVMGSLLEFQSGAAAPLRLYISGDTLVFDELREIPLRYPDIDLALLHLGGTRVLGVMLTMDGKQGVEALKIIAPKRAIPIHYNDYDRFTSPLDDFQREVAVAGLADRVSYLRHGEAYEFAAPAPAAGRVRPARR